MSDNAELQRFAWGATGMRHEHENEVARLRSEIERLRNELSRALMFISAASVASPRSIAGRGAADYMRRFKRRHRKVGAAGQEPPR
jgi:hypothetical protein